MPPAVVPVEDGGGGGGGAAKKEEAACESCHVAWSAWLSRLGRCLLASTLLPCHAALGLPPAAPDCVSVPAVLRGTLFLPSTGDRRVRLFLHEHATPAEPAVPAPILVLDLPAGLVGADIAVAGRIVLECQREWAGSGGALLESPKWLVYCNGRRVGFAVRRETMSDGEGWAMEKLWAVTAGAGRLPGGGVEYLRGQFERIVGSADAESFHLVEPLGWLGAHGDGGLSVFFHRI
ncbi:hypothetical protein ZWY2020_053475 [Hordeum vulgare]|nr:hypothetical protein ZWY2020_053475 [Hordeum vulgare]